MRRLPGSFVAVLGVFAGAGLLLGGGGGFLALGVPAAGLATVALQRTRDRHVLPELEWGTRKHADPAPSSPEPLLTQAAPGAAPLPPASQGRLAAALARAESNQVPGDLWFGAGLGFCVLEILLFAWIWAPTDANRPWERVLVDLPVMAHPMAGMAVIVAHRAVTRGRRDGADELFDTCPLAPTTRTVGHLLTAWVVVAALAAYCAAYLVVTGVRAGSIYGPLGASAWGDVAAALALGAGGVALGVALGRWAPWRLAPIVVVALLVFPIVHLGNIGEPHWSNARQLSTWPRYPDHDLLFTIRPAWWHLLWLVGLTALVGALALVRQGGRRTAAVLVGAALVTAVAGVAQTRPVGDAGAARLASLVAEPERHQACRSAGRVTVCAYEGYGAYARAMVAEAAPVVSAAPAAVAPVVLRQVFDGELAKLGPEVARALAGRTAGDGGAIGVGFEIVPAARTAARLLTAFAAVDLPPRPLPGDMPTVVAGQARGVLALWLASRGLPSDKALATATAFTPGPHDVPEGAPPPTNQDRGMAWPDPCVAGPSPVAWAPEDLAAARALMGLPEADVLRVVHARWAELTDPTTGTDQLLDAVGLRPVEPVSPVTAKPFTCDY